MFEIRKTTVIFFSLLFGMGLVYARQDLWGGGVFDAFHELVSNDLLTFGKSDREVTSLDDLRMRALALKNALDSFMSKELASAHDVKSLDVTKKGADEDKSKKPGADTSSTTSVALAPNVPLPPDPSVPLPSASSAPESPLESASTPASLAATLSSMPSLPGAPTTSATLPATSATLPTTSVTAPTTSVTTPTTSATLPANSPASLKI